MQLMPKRSVSFNMFSSITMDGRFMVNMQTYAEIGNTGHGLVFHLRWYKPESMKINIYQDRCEIIVNKHVLNDLTYFGPLLWKTIGGAAKKCYMRTTKFYKIYMFYQWFTRIWMLIQRRQTPSYNEKHNLK